jgi:Zn finger protein HypA/HybF involved in hydrogenase expression
MKDIKLLNCPICGSNNFDIYDGDDEKNQLWTLSHIYCNECPYKLEDSNNKKTIDDLITIHNNKLNTCPYCHEDKTIAKIAMRLGHRPDVAFLRIKKLENKLIELGELNNKPCFICGYDGDNYFNPDMHSCIKRMCSDYMKNDPLTTDDLWELL